LSAASQVGSLGALFLANVGYIVVSSVGAFWKIVTTGVSMLGFVNLLLFRIFLRVPLVVKNPSITLHQIMNIGVSSIPLIFVASVFTGAVTAESAEYQFRNFIPDRYIGTGVCLSVILELGPVLTGLVLAGRSSSAISAEIGSMREKEELDAMLVLNLDPLRYLAMPRILACIVMFPVLTVMKTMDKIGTGKPDMLKYANSGDSSGDKSKVVGYLSAVVYRDNSAKNINSGKVAVSPPTIATLASFAASYNPFPSSFIKAGSGF